LVRKGELVPFRILSAYVTAYISHSHKLSIYRFSVEDWRRFFFSRGGLRLFGVRW
ncbi:unnamed protein product, partial [Brassica oleracea]